MGQSFVKKKTHNISGFFSPLMFDFYVKNGNIVLQKMS